MFLNKYVLMKYLLKIFFVKLMKLPIAFFDSKMTGDIMQRINDHHRIENFLTSTTLNVLFSFVNLIVFSFVLAYYNQYCRKILSHQSIAPLKDHARKQSLGPSLRNDNWIFQETDRQ